MIMRISSKLPLLLLVTVVSLAGTATAASANGPWWHLQSGARPSYLPVSEENKLGEVVAGKGQVVATVANIGNASTSGTVTVADKLPGELVAKKIEAKLLEGAGGVSTDVVACELSTLTCTLSGNVLVPFSEIEVRVSIEVAEGATTCEPNSSACEKNEVSVTGGDAPPVSIARPVTISEKPAPFGVEAYEVTPEEEGGSLATHAGAHPFQVTGTLTLNQRAGGLNKSGTHYEAHPVALPKDLVGLLPAGLIGNPSPLAQCKLTLFFHNRCPQQSVIGVAMIGATEPISVGGTGMFTDAIVNLEPSHGEPARFGFAVTEAAPVFLDAHVRSGGDYGVTLSASNISQTVEFLSYKLIFWGVPGAASHDSTRGASCIALARGFSEEQVAGDGYPPCKPLAESNPPPFLALPTSCGAPLYTSTEADSWKEPQPAGRRLLFGETAPMQALVGCNQLPFEPSIKVTPDGTAASTPTGLTVDVHVPQESILNGQSYAQSNVRDITVALPAGVALNPSDAGGLEACPAGLVGFQGPREFETSPGISLLSFASRLPGSFAALEAGESEPLRPGTNFCSNASKIGTVTFRTPLLPNPLVGSVYLADQEANPFDSLVAMYVVAEDSVSGTLVKLSGEVSLCKSAGEAVDGMICQTSGQIITTFLNNPQTAFEDAELHFFGGERAPLATPSRCGAYTTNAAFVPWSAEGWDEAAVTVHASSTINITSGPDHTPCPGASLPFHPTVTGGATSIQAGAFSPFTATFSRSDGEQNMQSIEAKLPPGLLGILTGVEQCPEPQANQGLCGENSKIGESTVSVGVGGQPFSVRGGRFYLTGPYNGTGGCTVGQAGCAPFGLSFVVPAKAGPLDLANTKNNHPACDCVLVRAKIEINPVTAAITITSDPPGSPDAIPTSIEGIPLQIQHVNATTTRSGFQFNPTNCNEMEVLGRIQTSEGATDTIGVPFQVTNCAVLAFKPAFKVSTAGKTSRALGASLSVKLTYPNAPFGSQANIKSVKVDLPKQLPSRLTTLQKACTDAQFESNPAGCPADSRVGQAKAITPLIPVPLEGPAYFVSHGGAKFPELIIVLQGYNVTLDLHGETFINKAGITSSTFHAIPDAPVGSFQLTFPEGRYSALAANGNLCKSELTMPTAFVAQNGAEIHESTPISVTGCAPAVSVVRHSVKGATVTITASVPSAGKLLVSGSGLSRAVKSTGKAGTLSVSLKLSAHERTLLRSHPGRKLAVAVKLLFTPTHGHKLSAGVSVNVG
jgi:hypothetical protein